MSITVKLNQWWKTIEHFFSQILSVFSGTTIIWRVPLNSRQGLDWFLQYAVVYSYNLPVPDSFLIPTQLNDKRINCLHRLFKREYLPQDIPHARNAILWQPFFVHDLKARCLVINYLIRSIAKCLTVGQNDLNWIFAFILLFERNERIEFIMTVVSAQREISQFTYPAVLCKKWHFFGGITSKAQQANTQPGSEFSQSSCQPFSF